MVMKCVGFHITLEHAVCSEHHLNRPTIDGKDLLSWLANFNTDEYLCLFYHLDLSASVIAHRIGLDKIQCETLLRTTKVHTKDWILTYIPDKFLSIKFGSEYSAPYAMYSNASQYCVPDLESNTYESCIEKADIARDIGQEVLQSLLDLKCESPNNLISASNVFAKFWLPKFNFPTTEDTDEVDENIGEYFFQTLEGGWFETPRKGAFGKVWDWDIKSAYGSALSTLPDIRKGTWEQVSEFDPNAPVGVYNCKVDITAPFSPIGFRIGEGDHRQSFTPIKEWDKFLTTQQIQCIDKYKLGTVEVIDGYAWKPTEWKTPYAPLMKRLYEIKETSTGIKKTVTKKIMSAMWGLLGQTLKDKDGNKKFGDFVNWVYHAMVEINTRIKVFELCMTNNTIPIAIRLDGIVTDKKLDCIDIGTGMGQWKISNAEKRAICLNADLCLIEGVDTGQQFSVTYDWMQEQVKNDPTSSVYSMTRNSPMTIGKAVQNNCIERIGEILPTTRSVDVTYEMKRIFKDLPTCGKDIITKQYNDSIPKSVEMLRLMELPEIDEDTLLTNRE